jgi:hypothetical protein
MGVFLKGWRDYEDWIGDGWGLIWVLGGGMSEMANVML